MDRREQLRQWREAQGISWAALGRRLGYSASYMTRIATAVRPVTDAFLWRFAQCYGWDVARQVFDGDCPEEAQR